MTNERPTLRVTYFGHFFGGRIGVPQPCELLVPALRERTLDVETASRFRPLALRAGETLAAALRAALHRRIVIVDTFSGRGFSWSHAILGIAARRCPTVVVLHGGGLPAFAERAPARMEAYLRKATCVVSPSESMRRALARFRDDIRCIPNPIDLAACEPRPGPRIADPTAPRILWMRSFHRVYEPDAAVRALAAVRDRVPGARLTMAGPVKDDSLDAARECAARLGLGDAVGFPGAVPKTDVPRLMRSHDIFLSTARIDNLPVSVAEAAACAMPVAATRVGGVPEILDDGRCGILVDPGDAEAMAAAIVFFASNLEEADRMGRAARVHAARHDVGRVASAWIDLLAGLAPAAAPRDASQPA